MQTKGTKTMEKIFDETNGNVRIIKLRLTEKEIAAAKKRKEDRKNRLRLKDPHNDASEDAK